MKPHLIVGIDPGTTVGYAILNTEGKIQKISSGKEISLSDLIKTIYSYGSPLIIGCDKQKIPEFVEKLRSKTGSKAICPKEDLPINEKKALVKIKTSKKSQRSRAPRGFLLPQMGSNPQQSCGVLDPFEWNNTHEMDALASAIYAYKEYQSLLNKISLHCKKHNKQHIQHKITDLVIKNNLNIQHAINRIEAKPTIIKQKTRTKSKHSIITKPDPAQPLLSENKKLKKKIKHLKSNISKLKKQDHLAHAKEHAKKTMLFRNERIHNLSMDIDKWKAHANKLSNEIDLLNAFIASQNGRLLIKRLPNLTSYPEQLLNLQETDILLIDKPYEYSLSTLLKIKSKILICNKPPKEIQQRFICLNESKLNLIKTKHFALVQKDHFEQELKNSNLIKKIITNYRSNR